MKITKETLRRAWRTFLQAFASYIAVNICVVDFTAAGDVVEAAITGVLISAVAAGLAAVMNLEKPEVTETEIE